MPTLRFNNHDDCGDWLFRIGEVDCQLLNTTTNLFFVVAGTRLVACARTTEARQSGVLLLCVGWFSAVYHSTSSWGGFLLDIAAMSVWATHLFGCCQVFCAELGTGVLLPQGPRAAEWRVGAACGLAALAIGGPYLSFEVLGASPVFTWNVWANAFLVLILLSALPPLFALWMKGLLHNFLGNVAIAISTILLGVVFTQLIQQVCVPGYFAGFPFHSCWHLCSSTSASFTVWILDEGLALAGAAGAAAPAAGGEDDSCWQGAAAAALAERRPLPGASASLGEALRRR